MEFWGKNNRLDHCYIAGKTNEGPTVCVRLRGDNSIDNNHLIDNNHFGIRPNFGRNNAETIRIGTSKYSMKSSKTIVENNTFENCNGEMEIISNKSCDNIFRNNLFLESEGTLTIRQGKNALIEGNVFMGNQKPKTGGIRLAGSGHIVRNNLLVGIKGSSNRAPIACLLYTSPSPRDA